MSDAAPLVTTIIPMFNAEATIARTLEAVRAQTIGDIEAIVVNDGSTDGAPGIVEAFAGTDRRIRRIDQPNAGLPAARNTGLDAARGEYVHFLDADDTIEPHAYERMIAAERSGATGAVVAGHVVRTMDGQVIDTNVPNRAEVGLDDLVDRVGFVCHAPLIRRDRIGAMRFDETFRSYEDLDFWFRLGETGLRWACINEPLVHYAMRPGSMSRNFGVMLRSAQDAVWNLFDRQRALASDDRLMDTSIARRDTRLGHFALAYATQTVMLGGAARVNDAIELFGNALGRKWVTPEEAAEKVHHGFTYALARPYDDDLDRESAALAPLPAFWRRCEALGWAAPGLSEEVPIHLRRVKHEHAMIARAILDELRGERALTIIGFGRNGSLLAHEARRAGMRVTVRDDRFTSGADAPEWVGVEPMDAPLTPERPVVISVLADDTLTTRFAHAQRLVRWREVRRDLFTPTSMRVA